MTHPQTRFISFTGSKGVGLHINEQAAKTGAQQRWIKRVVAEMGGKDAIVVADDADLDSAAAGVVFGVRIPGAKMLGLFAVDSRRKGARRAYGKSAEHSSHAKIGAPLEAETNVAAVINRRSFGLMMGYITKGVEEGGEVLLGGNGDDSQGYYIEPTIIDNVKPGATIEQEEVFAPVLAVIKARDFDHALEIANDTEFGLTGAVYRPTRAASN